MANSEVGLRQNGLTGGEKRQGEARLHIYMYLHI